jgi:hypothetical protein
VGVRKYDLAANGHFRTADEFTYRTGVADGRRSPSPDRASSGKQGASPALVVAEEPKRDNSGGSSPRSTAGRLNGIGGLSSTD